MRNDHPTPGESERRLRAALSRALDALDELRSRRQFMTVPDDTMRAAEIEASWCRHQLEVWEGRR